MWPQSSGGNEVSGAARSRAFRVFFPKGENTMARRQVPFESTKRPDSRARSARDGNPDHHLWRNGRLWWVAFTVHLPGWQKERVRLSLGTADLHEARRLRDEVLRRYPETRECQLSLRMIPAGARRRRVEHGAHAVAA